MNEIPTKREPKQNQNKIKNNKTINLANVYEILF